MIKGNRLINGYGSLVVGNSWDGLKITYIEPPVEIGMTITKEIDEQLQKLKAVNLRLDYTEACKLRGQLENINENNKEIEFKEYIIDFNNYNEKSVNVWKRAAQRYINSLISFMAC